SLLVLTIAFSSCEKESETVSNLQGRWVLNTIAVEGGSSISGFGSSITFIGDKNEGFGSDFSAIDFTVGSFSYSLSSDEKTLTILDTSMLGGMYNFSFQVEQVSLSSLKLKTYSELGVATFTFSR
ncbi:MAG: hypothetical protein JXR34_06065, partial [Bacteroidales bacterium]|nr:hypothetical protein [Bacteroidales bacterium]